MNIKIASLVAASAVVATVLTLGPAGSASATAYSISGTTVDLRGANSYFEVRRSHNKAGTIRIKLDSLSPCGGALKLSLRNGKSSDATRITRILSINTTGDTYYFRAPSKSTTIAPGVYYVTGAYDGGGFCGRTAAYFAGTISM